MVNKIKVHLNKKYITKALDKDTLLKVIASEHPSVLHRLYMIANEVGEYQYFMELDHPVLACTGKIKTTYAYTGPAKEQASVVSFMKERVKQKPSFLITLKVYEKVGQKVVFDFKHETTSVDAVINVINKLEQKALELCQDKVDTY
jgi:hypothetical protein